METKTIRRKYAGSLSMDELVAGLREARSRREREDREKMLEEINRCLWEPSYEEVHEELSIKRGLSISAWVLAGPTKRK